MTTSEGQRYYMNVIDEDEWEKAVRNVTASNKSSSLLPVSYHIIKMKAEKEVNSSYEQ